MRIISLLLSSLAMVGDPGLSPMIKLLLPHRLLSELMNDLVNFSLALGDPWISLKEVKLGCLPARLVVLRLASTPDFWPELAA